MRIDKKTILGTICLVLATTAAVGQQFNSGPAQTVMIELYTSEGCSSCPPAESLLNSFVDNPRLWSSFVPLAFHVDYWDYLGWRDHYALPENAKRQRRYADLKNLRTVYTPAFVVNGVGWRPGWINKTPEGGGQTVGELSVTLEGQGFTARFDTPDPNPPRLQLNLAILGMGFDSAIKAGENAGRDSRHEFVVLSHQRFRADGAQWEGRLQDWDSKAATRLALVAWVSRLGDPAPLQATGGFLSLSRRRLPVFE